MVAILSSHLSLSHSHSLRSPGLSLNVLNDTQPIQQPAQRQLGPDFNLTASYIKPQGYTINVTCTVVNLNLPTCRCGWWVSINIFLPP